MAGAVRPHALTESTLVRFLSDLEGSIATRIRREAVKPSVRTPVKGEKLTLSVPAPFDRVYWTYLVAMIDLTVGDTKQYAVSKSLFDEAFDAYARWYQQTGGNGAR